VATLVTLRRRRPIRGFLTVRKTAFHWTFVQPKA
jgi:hypothetical protein